MSAAVTSDAHVRTSSLGRQALTIGRASGFFLIATSAIALHIVDDNYLQPKPGTSAGDHLASGLIPIAVLAAVAAALPHLPPDQAPSSPSSRGGRGWPT